MSDPQHAGRRSPSPAGGFTIIELLAVIAVIAILASILIPVIGGAQNSAKRQKTRVQFSQWATAIEAFRQEYGFYPDFSAIAGNRIDDATDAEVFVQTLSGRQVNGAAMEGASIYGITAGNRKRIGFCTFSSADLTSEASPKLQDAFGNTQIAVLMDKNLDGMIGIGVGTVPTDYPLAGVPEVSASAGGAALPKPFGEGDTVRAGVIFYSAGDGNSLVKSWE